MKKRFSELKHYDWIFVMMANAPSVYVERIERKPTIMDSDFFKVETNFGTYALKLKDFHRRSSLDAKNGHMLFTNAKDLMVYLLRKRISLDILYARIDKRKNDQYIGLTIDNLIIQLKNHKDFLTKEFKVTEADIKTFTTY